MGKATRPNRRGSLGLSVKTVEVTAVRMERLGIRIGRPRPVRLRAGLATHVARARNGSVLPEPLRKPTRGDKSTFPTSRNGEELELSLPARIAAHRLDSCGSKSALGSQGVFLVASRVLPNSAPPAAVVSLPQLPLVTIHLHRRGTPWRAPHCEAQLVRRTSSSAFSCSRQRE